MPYCRSGRIRCSACPSVRPVSRRPPVPTMNCREPVRIGNLIGPLRREAFVVVGVAVQHQLGARGIHFVQEPARLLRIAVRARAPARAVPDGEDGLEPPRRQVLAQPLQLRRVRVLLDLAVERDQVPPRRGQRQAVVAPRRRAGALLAEIAEVRRRRGRPVVVIARAATRSARADRAVPTWACSDPRYSSTLPRL